MWQQKLSPKDMAKIVEMLLTNGRSMDVEFPSAEHLHRDFCEELATLLTACCGGKLVEIDDAGNFVIQADPVAPEVERSIWRFAGQSCENAVERTSLRKWVPYPTTEESCDD